MAEKATKMLIRNILIHSIPKTVYQQSEIELPNFFVQATYFYAYYNIMPGPDMCPALCLVDC